MDFWQLVDRDRGRILELVGDVMGAPSRARPFGELRRELERYLDAMESVLHPALAADERTESYVGDLEHEHAEIRRFLRDLAATPDKDGHDFARRFDAFAYALEHYFSLQEHGALTVARSTLARHGESLRRAFEREQVAADKAEHWNVPKAVVPERYGVPAGVALGTVAAVIGLALAATFWRRRPRGPDRTPRELKERSQANRATREAQAALLH